jgi:hypothetical protein
MLWVMCGECESWWRWVRESGAVSSVLGFSFDACKTHQLWTGKRRHSDIGRDMQMT